MQIKINAPKIPKQLMEIDNLIDYIKQQGEEEPIITCRISEVEYTENDFTKFDSSASIFDHCRFNSCDFSKAAFVDVRFENCDFSNCQFGDAYFCRCEFHNCKCVGTDFHESMLKHTLISDSIFRFANLSGVHIEAVVMQNCDFTNAALSEMKYKKWTITDSRLIHTNFFRTMLKNFDLSENELEDIIVSDSLEELKGAKLSAIQMLEVARLMGITVV